MEWELCRYLSTFMSNAEYFVARKLEESGSFLVCTVFQGERFQLNIKRIYDWRGSLFLRHYVENNEENYRLSLYQLSGPKIRLRRYLLFKTREQRGMEELVDIQLIIEDDDRIRWNQAHLDISNNSYLQTVRAFYAHPDNQFLSERAWTGWITVREILHSN